MTYAEIFIDQFKLDHKAYIRTYLILDEGPDHGKFKPNITCESLRAGLLYAQHSMCFFFYNHHHSVRLNI